MYITKIWVLYKWVVKSLRPDEKGNDLKPWNIPAVIGETIGITVFIAENGQCDSSSNPRRVCLRFM